MRDLVLKHQKIFAVIEMLIATVAFPVYVIIVGLMEFVPDYALHMKWMYKVLRGRDTFGYYR